MGRNGVSDKNTEKRITVLYEALMDISHMDKGHQCQCQCANHAIEHAHNAIKKEHNLRWELTKEERCFGFHLPDMDRLFQGTTKWDWRTKKHLSKEWKELAASIRVSMNYSPYYGNGDLLHRWFGKWAKYKKMLSQPIMNGNKLVEVRKEN